MAAFLWGEVRKSKVSEGKEAVSFQPSAVRRAKQVSRLRGKT